MKASEQWSNDLRQWGIPDHILAQAPESPWIHPTSLFRVADDADLQSDNPSRRRALEALRSGGSVLDVGCGGGRAAFGLTPPADSVVGVDHQPAMLDLFVTAARTRGVSAQTVLGDWPAVAPATPSCDVVVCHHVFFNVSDLVPFAQALTEHAHRRVVIEMPMHHPLSSLSDAWQQFWGLVRPTTPTARDAVRVLREAGLDVSIELWEQPDRHGGPVTDLDVQHTRVRLCLAADRDAEVRQFLESQPRAGRPTATLWWDR
jgi:SAM-dependent methyltransferase